MSKNRHAVKRIAHVSLLITLAIVIRNLSYSFYIGSIMATRISFSGIFTRMAAILFGPVYGGLASGILDIIGYLIKPEGPFIPWLTLTAIIGGVVAGFLWRWTGKADSIKAGRCYLLFFACIGLIGGINLLVLSVWPDSFWGRVLDGIGKNKDLAASGLVVFAGIGFALYLFNLLIKRLNSKWQVNEQFFRVLLTVGVSGLLVTTLNTWILQAVFPELAAIDFLVFLIPRLIKEAFVVLVQAYLVTFLLSIYNRYFVVEPVPSR
ncbi:MAG TPA: folate family ECF transporter S component [Thermoclostridium caenicola]|uniref:folate family ECF transporter S component n=1 Tax=Thermoclostridium caenicola TaxID=659425 RepID=UPI002CB6EBBA|nr:folate family ECF transporter S component [Thermoclostridium caenicola]HOL85465.1 folate family ECF transporter S component [Thermoclostridium caenicola]HPO76223.1 folate family ECF transporter S component [Thermoclostridium caenicola]